MNLISRNIFASLTVALTLVGAGACGDDGGGSTGGESNGTDGGSTTGSGSDTTTTEPQTSTEPATSTNPTTTDGTTSTTTPPTTGETTTGETASTTNVSSTTTVGETTTGETLSTTDGEGSSSTGNGTGDPVEECLMDVDPNDQCGQCTCENCSEEIQACEEDPGCAAIVQCVQDSGCQGQECGLACGETIQMNGGFMGEPVMKAMAIGACVEQNCGQRCMP